eukprot:gnl/MRDRNA2_/MRDRNA2_92273_c0_seq1.p1 gnl/MRDRNA2_/MRDRNA2_92273_c0~~gnl/MRDRNA2_/MRDRNA2_92273_c0_seq1.p1  ORF type:complete len:269 (+),score=50.18 gnl/MRDRNA2_/MRDRNA2_92273_c0_seq1:101-907(+)
MSISQDPFASWTTTSIGTSKPSRPCSAQSRKAKRVASLPELHRRKEHVPQELQRRKEPIPQVITFRNRRFWKRVPYNENRILDQPMNVQKPASSQGQKPTALQKLPKSTSAPFLHGEQQKHKCEELAIPSQKHFCLETVAKSEKYSDVSAFMVEEDQQFSHRSHGSLPALEARSTKFPAAKNGQQCRLGIDLSDLERNLCAMQGSKRKDALLAREFRKTFAHRLQNLDQEKPTCLLENEEPSCLLEHEDALSEVSTRLSTWRSSKSEL